MAQTTAPYRSIHARPSRLFGLIQEIGEGEEWPRGHGFAYRRWNSFGCVTALFPLNYLLGFARTFWLEVRFRWVPKSKLDLELATKCWMANHEGWDRGYSAGRAAGLAAGEVSGYKRGWNGALDHLSASVRAENIQREEARARQENP